MGSPLLLIIPLLGMILPILAFYACLRGPDYSVISVRFLARPGMLYAGTNAISFCDAVEC